MTGRPNSMRHLDDALRRLCGNAPERFLATRTLMANAIVARMLPDGVVKGGSALKMRFGDATTRFTTDLDTATATDPDEYAERLGESLSRGWNGFSGRVVVRDPAKPEGIPPEYVMRPFDVKLSYNGKPWCTVPLEVGHDEIGDADEADSVSLPDMERVFSSLGFEAPGTVSLMPLTHQVAQKIHALTGGGDRVRDLVDLQLIAANAEIDLRATGDVCERLFAYRRKQSWPPVVVEGDGWDELYAAQSRGLDVLPSAAKAVEWANALISRIARAGGDAEGAAPDEREFAAKMDAIYEAMGEGRRSEHELADER